MSVKSIIDIDVQDDSFRKFKDIYDQYQAELAKAPAKWADIDAAIAGLAKRMADLAHLQQGHVEIGKRIIAAQASGTHALETQARLWRDIEHRGKLFGQHIHGVTLNILKWGPLLALALGALGTAGGLFGLSRLAATASGGLRNALGLGATYGGAQAFTNAFGQVIDPRQFLGATNAALHDMTKRVGLVAAGMTPAELAPGRPTEAVSFDLIKHLRQLALRAGPGAPAMQQLITSHRLEPWANLQDMMRLRAMSPQQWGYFTQEYQRDFGRFRVGQAGVEASVSRAERELAEGAAPVV